MTIRRPPRTSGPLGEDFGVTSVEYALVAGIMVVLIVAGVAFLGGALRHLFMLLVDNWPS